MEKTNQNLLQKLTQILNVDKIISPEDIEAIRDALIGVLANNKKELESLTDETKQAVNSILDKVLNEHDTYLEKTKQIAQEAKSETTEAINSTLKSLEEVKALCKEVMECKPENGEDADEEYVIGEVLNRIKLPEYKEIVLDDGGAIVDKINSLPVNEENQIDAKHIKNLPEGKGGRVISGGVTRKIVEQMIEAAGGGGGTPGGSDTQVQFNDGGSFGGDAGLTYNKTTDTLTIGGGLTVDTNTLFVDATNNVVGIGTASPLTQTGNKLQVGDNSAAHQYLVFQTNNGTERGIQYYLADGTTLRGYMKWEGEEDLLLKGDTLKISTQNVTNPFHFGDGGGIGLFGIGTTAPTHSLTLNSTSSGIALYNTADQTTNYERALMQWSGNIFQIGTASAGSGTTRVLRIGQGSVPVIDFNTASSPKIQYNAGSSSGTGATVFHNFISTSTSSSGTPGMFSVSPTINQSSTAGYTALLVNPTETTTGSGSKLLADFQVGGVSKFSVANTGITTITNTNDATASTQVLILQGDSATPANNDEIYQSFLLSSSTGVQREFGRISTRANSVTNGSEAGMLLFAVINSGSISDEMRLTASALFPSSNDGLGLGTSTSSWSDLFLASGGVINWNNGNATLTHSTGLLTSNVPVASPQVYNADNAITATANAATVTRAFKNNVVTNNSAAGITITLSTTSAAAGDTLIVQSLPSSAVAQTITWVNTENSDVTPSANLNASTTSPRTDGFKWNPLTSKWRCIASC